MNNLLLKISKSTKACYLACLILFVSAMIYLSPAEAAILEAGDVSRGPITVGFDDVFAKRLCIFVDAAQGKIGTSLGAIAIILLGVGAFFGAVSWASATVTGAALFAIFGSTVIIEEFTEYDYTCGKRIFAAGHPCSECNDSTEKCCNNMCIPKAACCGDCPDGKKCCNGRCIENSVCCNCSSDQLCCNGDCLPASACCSGNCNPGYKCCAGTCIANSECCGGCPVGSTCQAGNCVDICNNSCNYDTQKCCANGNCTPKGSCCGGCPGQKCCDGACKDCCDNNDCNVGEYCVPVSGRCDPIVEECSPSCDPGYFCVGGVCMG